MIKVNVMDPAFNRAYWRANRDLAVELLETPRQFGQRWRETYRCRRITPWLPSLPRRSYGRTL